MKWNICVIKLARCGSDGLQIRVGIHDTWTREKYKSNHLEEIKSEEKSLCQLRKTSVIRKIKSVFQSAAK